MPWGFRRGRGVQQEVQGGLGEEKEIGNERKMKIEKWGKEFDNG